MDTAAVIGLVLAALLIGALLPVLVQLRATLRAAQETLDAASHTVAEINRMTPALKSTLESVERLGQRATTDSSQSSTLSTLSQLLPVALAVFQALTGQDEAEAPCAPHDQSTAGPPTADPSTLDPSTPKGEPA